MAAGLLASVWAHGDPTLAIALFGLVALESQQSLVPVFVLGNAFSIFLDIARLLVARHAFAYGLLFIVQIAAMLCKVRILSSMQTPCARTSRCWTLHGSKCWKQLPLPNDRTCCRRTFRTNATTCSALAVLEAPRGLVMVRSSSPAVCMTCTCVLSSLSREGPEEWL